MKDIDVYEILILHYLYDQYLSVVNSLITGNILSSEVLHYYGQYFLK
jgi:hypothetical protein